MKIRKLTAAVLAAAAPITGVLPDVMGMTASAASLDPAPAYTAGDKFYVGFDSSGNVAGEPASDVT